MVSADLGASAPTLRRLAALPPAGEAVWPTLLLDVRYEGEFSLLLETKVGKEAISIRKSGAVEEARLGMQHPCVPWAHEGGPVPGGRWQLLIFAAPPSPEHRWTSGTRPPGSA